MYFENIIRSSGILKLGGYLTDIEKRKLCVAIMLWHIRIMKSWRIKSEIPGMKLLNLISEALTSEPYELCCIVYRIKIVSILYFVN